MGGALRTAAETLPAAIMVEDPDYAGPFTLVLRRGTLGGPFETVLTTTVGPGWHDLHLPLLAPGTTAIFYVEAHEPGPDRMAHSRPPSTGGAAVAPAHGNGLCNPCTFRPIRLAPPGPAVRREQVEGSATRDSDRFGPSPLSSSGESSARRSASPT
ncbi:MAG: hypothetical protein R3F60_08155 [bacterium]